MPDVLTKLGRWGSAEPCAQRMASEIFRPLKAGCDYSKNNTVVLIVATDLKLIKLKLYCQRYSLLYTAFHREEGCWFFCLGSCDQGQGNPYGESRKLCLPKLLNKLSWEIRVRNRRRTGNGESSQC